MKREEVMDTLRVYLERQIYGKGLIPSINAVIKESTGWEKFKIQFEEDKLQIFGNKILDVKYKDVQGIIFSSEGSEGKIFIFLKSKSPILIKSPLRTQWYHFSSTSSVMKYRWGHLDVGDFLYCKGEKATGDGPFLTFTRRPFDFDLEGNCVVLNDDERWLGYLINEENSHVYAKEKGRPIVDRTLGIEGFLKNNAVVRECITYTFKDVKYRYVSYYNFDTTKF